MEDTKKKKEPEKEQKKRNVKRRTPTYGRLFGAADAYGAAPVLTPSETIDFSEGTDSTP